MEKLFNKLAVVLPQPKETLQILHVGGCRSVLHRSHLLNSGSYSSLTNDVTKILNLRFKPIAFLRVELKVYSSKQGKHI